MVNVFPLFSYSVKLFSFFQHFSWGKPKYLHRLAASCSFGKSWPNFTTKWRTELSDWTVPGYSPEWSVQKNCFLWGNQKSTFKYEAGSNWNKWVNSFFHSSWHTVLLEPKIDIPSPSHLLCLLLSCKTLTPYILILDLSFHQFGALKVEIMKCDSNC